MVQKKDPEETQEGQTEGKGRKLLQGLRVRIKFKGRLYGSLPKNKELLTNWIASKANRPPTQGGPYGDEDTLDEKLKSLGLSEEQAKKLKEGKEIEYEEVDLDFEAPKTPDKEGIVEEEEKASCSFRMIELDGNPTVPIMRDFQIKAAMGQAATTMRLTTATRGVKTNLREGLQIRPQYIRFERDGTHMDGPDGQEDFIGHVVTPQGRRSVLKRCDYIEDAELTFDVYWVRGLISPKIMKNILVFAGMFNGLGSQRRFEAGKFVVLEAKEFEADPDELIEL